MYPWTCWNKLFQAHFLEIKAAATETEALDYSVLLVNSHSLITVLKNKPEKDLNNYRQAVGRYKKIFFLKSRHKS